SPGQPRGHDVGVPATVGQPAPTDRLLLIQGPLLFNMRSRKWGAMPRLENADLHGGFPPTTQRLRLWMQAQVGVVGRPDWIFIKLHTHGAPEKNANMLLGPAMRQFHLQMAETLRRASAKLYYVNAREMAQ